MRPVRTPLPCPPSLPHLFTLISFHFLHYVPLPPIPYPAHPTLPASVHTVEGVHSWLCVSRLPYWFKPARPMYNSQSGLRYVRSCSRSQPPFLFFLLPAPNHQSSHIPPTPSDWLTAPTHHCPTTTRTSRSACHYHGSQICVFRVVILITLAWRPSKLVGLRPVRQGDTARGDASLSLPVPR